MELAAVDLPHAEAGRIEAELRNQGVEIVGVEYGSHARYILGFAPGERPLIDASLAALTQGSATTKDAGHRWIELGG